MLISAVTAPQQRRKTFCPKAQTEPLTPDNMSATCLTQQTGEAMAGFNDAKFLKAHFADCATMRSLLQAYGFEPPAADTAEKWWRRRSVPGAWLPILLGVLELEHGEPVSLLPYIER